MMDSLINVIVQIIGALGYLTLANSYFNKQKSGTLLTQIVANSLLGIHFFLLSGLTGAICDIICLTAYLLIYLFDKFKVKRKKLLTFLLIPCGVAIALVTYKDIFSLFPIIASCIVIASFMTESQFIVRVVGVISAICWLVYGIIFKSYVSIVFEVIIIISSLFSLYRENKSKNTEKTA